MASNLRTERDRGAAALPIHPFRSGASALRSAASARAIVAEDATCTLNRREFPAVSLWSDPERLFRHRIATIESSCL